MPPPYRICGTPSLCSLLVAIFLLSATCLAQGQATSASTPQTSNAPATTRATQPATPATTASSPAAPSTSAAAPSSRPSAGTNSASTGSTSGAATSNSATSNSAASSDDEETSTARPSSGPIAVITVTATPSTTSTGTRTAPPTITGNGSSATRGGSLPTNLPTLSGQFSYPPPSVPPTANAPFMRQSTLPDGFVFIIVGALLGFLGFSVLAWRGLVAWSIHRSVKRAAMEQTIADSKVMLRPRGNGFYTAGAGSTLSLDQLTSSARPTATFNRKSHMSNASLFYSPTARAASVVDPLANRGSSYVPGPYYPAGASGAAGAGASSHHLNTPQSHRHSRTRSRGTSPPSPSLSPSRGVDPTYARASNAPIPSQASTSSLNLSSAPQGRAPSAYLEDLFEGHRSPFLPGQPERY